MHIRFSNCIGTPVTLADTGEGIAFIDSPLIDPDTGLIEAFFVRASGGFLSGQTLILSCLDILRWGTSVHVRDEDVIGPPEDFLRLQPLWEDSRTILGNHIRTEAGRPMGKCADVQFHSKTFQCEWLFPRRFWRWRNPIPLSEVLEVRKEAIIVRDPTATVKEEHSALEDVLEKVSEITEKPAEA